MNTRNLIVAACLAFPAVAMAQQNTYHIKAKFKDPNTKGKAYLYYYKGEKNVRDSAVVNNGAFELKGQVEGIQQAHLAFYNTGVKSGNAKQRGNDGRSVFLDNSTMMINVVDSIKTAKITGSDVMSQYEVYQGVVGVAERNVEKQRSAYYKLSPEQRKDKANQEKLNKESDIADKKLDEAMLSYIKNNPDSYFSLEAINKIAGSYFDAAKAAPLYKQLTARLRNSKEGKMIGVNIEGALATEPGKMAPDFTQKDVNDKPVRLSDFKGKYVLLDFWASWCGPCRAENPKVLKAYNAFKDKNFTVVGVSIDRNDMRAAWLKAVKDDALPWTQLVDPDHTDPKSASNLYAIKAIPSNFLIDPQGKILAKNLRGEELEKKLAEVIK
ncbi:TlpA disulfide reductase family protein [Pedobacter nyackensis]|uniref:TlpA disulfide reductase family protein n=1 Tax=Pedobacter nyackensis TaxID=475255 RepID=UPI00292D2A38|nr:TlpA disulfide reductase family protein [Pedobacter nyackensis]